MTFRLEDFLAYICTTFFFFDGIFVPCFCSLTVLLPLLTIKNSLESLFYEIFFIRKWIASRKLASFHSCSIFKKRTPVDGIVAHGKAFRYEYTILQAQYISNVSDLFDYFLNFSPQFLWVCGCFRSSSFFGIGFFQCQLSYTL